MTNNNSKNDKIIRTKELTLTDKESYGKFILTQQTYIARLEQTIRSQMKMINHLQSMIFQKKRVIYRREWFDRHGEFLDDDDE